MTQAAVLANREMGEEQDYHLPRVLEMMSEDQKQEFYHLVEKKAWIKATTVQPFTDEEEAKIAQAEKEHGARVAKVVRNTLYNRHHWNSLRWFLFGGLVDIPVQQNPRKAWDPVTNPFLKIRMPSFVWTQDEHDQATPFKRLPDKKYLRICSYAWVHEPLLAIPKSRQLMMTWLFCSIAVHETLFRDAKNTAWISKKFDDANAHLHRRVQGIADRLPHKRFDIPKHKFIKGLFECENTGSLIQAMGEEAKGLRQYTYCVAPRTKVLTKNLKYVPIETLSKGDYLVGFDEEPNPGRRSWRKSKVEEIGEVYLPSYRITLSDGTQVICSGEHRWGVKHNNSIKWLRTDEMRVDYGKMSTKIARLLPVWKKDNSRSAGYLAGVFDGDGHIRQVRLGSNSYGFQIMFAQNYGLVLDKVSELLTTKGFSHSIYDKRYGTHANLYLESRDELFRFLGEIRPSRLLKNFDIDKSGSISYIEWLPVISREYLGSQKLISMKTSTKTFVAEGLASHNSWVFDDETAFQEQASDIVQAAIPTVKGGGRFTLVSSSNGKDPFYHIVTDNDKIPVPPGG